MYPLSLFFLIGLFKGDTGLPLYLLPLTLFGVAIAAYQYALQIGLIETSAVCTAGACSIKYVEYLGYITIPFLSFIAFLLLTMLLLFARKHK